MSNTFSQIHIQIVFAVKHRQNLITSDWEERLYQYITGIVQRKEQKMLAINGVQDHIHFLIGMRPECAISDLVREIKKASTELINDQHFTPHPFHWQAGYGAFSYSKSNISPIIDYIKNQKIHHQKQTFKTEYIELLTEHDIQFEEKYLFDFIEL